MRVNTTLPNDCGSSLHTPIFPCRSVLGHVERLRRLRQNGLTDEFSISIAGLSLRRSLHGL